MAAIVAEGTQKLAVPFPLVRQPGCGIAGLLGAAAVTGCACCAGPIAVCGCGAFRIGGLGFVPPLHRFLDVALEEFGQVVVTEELVLVGNPDEDGGSVALIRGHPFR